MGEPKPLREWREARGMTQAQLAEEVGVSRVMIAHLEAGKHTPVVTLAYRIADALGVSDREIIWRDVARKPPEKKPSKDGNTV